MGHDASSLALSPEEEDRQPAAAGGSVEALFTRRTCRWCAQPRSWWDAAEWLDAHTAEVPAAGATEVTLQVGWGNRGPDALLVEVRVYFADGSRAHARYRTNAIESPPGE